MSETCRSDKLKYELHAIDILSQLIVRMQNE